MAETAFAGVPRTVRGHLVLHFYEAVLALVCYAQSRAAAAQSGRNILDEHPFLRGYLREVFAHAGGERRIDDALAWLREGIVSWESTVTARLPLRALRDELALHDTHVLALMLLGLVEEDARFGAVFAAAQGVRGTRRPGVALVHAVVAATRPSDAPLADDAWRLCRPLVDAGLADVVNAAEPRADWQLRVPAPLWSVVGGDVATEPLPGVRWRAAESLPQLADLVVDDEQALRLVEAQGLLASGGAAALIVRGMPGSLRVESAAVIARCAGRGLLEARAQGVTLPDAWQLLGPLATLLGAMPLFVLEPAPGELFHIPEWVGYRGPVAVILGHDGGVAGAASERAVLLQLAPDPAELRQRHWQRAFPHADPAVHGALAAHYTIGGRYVQRAAELAAAHAAVEGRDTVTAADVRIAARAINRQQLDSLATRLDDGGGWERLILHPSTTQELRHLERRCRHRERLMRTLGSDIPGGLDRGVRALFQGPSGTGKTLAARVLAAELGLDLYRVDLSTVISKYIGETEKNLSRVLGRAEDLDVILLLDEGDSLLGRRTQIRSAHDRWANLETNYLLQRLDGYSGIVIATTNLPGSIDPAFQRRMDAVVRFHLPAYEERWSLWQQHLPLDHCIDADQLQQAALRYELTGGQIRNAAVDAALLGFVSSDGRLRGEDLVSAADAEYRKAGASSPRPRSAPDAGQGDAMTGFLGAIQ